MCKNICNYTIPAKNLFYIIKNGLTGIFDPYIYELNTPAFPSHSPSKSPVITFYSCSCMLTQDFLIYPQAQKKYLLVIHNLKTHDHYYVAFETNQRLTKIYFLTDFIILHQFRSFIDVKKVMLPREKSIDSYSRVGFLNSLLNKFESQVITCTKQPKR